MAQAVEQANWNQATTAAKQLMEAAHALGMAVELTENLWRWPAGNDALKAETENAEKILMESGDLIQAMRELAMRLDRTAFQYTPERSGTGWWNAR